MKRKILIIGLGGIGEAHLKSIINYRNYQIEVCEKDLKKINILKSKYNTNNIKYITRLPKNKKYYLCIISTNPKERFGIAKAIIKCNNLRYILFEKFVFSKIHNYEKMANYLKKKKVDAYVNTWADFIITSLRLKLKYEKIDMNIFVQNGRMLTNLIHFTSLFSLLKNDFNLKIIKLKNMKFFRSKNISYHEMSGKIFIESSDGSKLNIKSKLLKKNIFEIVCKSKSYNFKISLTQNLKINKFNYITKTKKSINFPLVSKVTLKNIKNFNKTLFLKYDIVKKNSILILNILKKSSKKYIFVR